MKQSFHSFSLAVACLVLLLQGTVGAAQEATARIVATGEGSVSLAPDMAVLSLTVNREADTARSALDANSAAMTEVIAAMEKEGIAARDMQTAGFSIQPRYVYPKPRGEKPPQIVGYTVRNSLTVKIRDLERLGELLDRSVSLGVNEGGNVRFSNDDPTAALSQARKAAVEDALARIRTMADAAGVGVGSIIAITESSGMSGPRPMMESMAMARAADAVPIAAGENSYRVAVTVSVAIDQ
jgi:uncharacterized protein